MEKFKGTKGIWSWRINSKSRRTRIEVNIQEYSDRPEFLQNIHSYILDEDQCTAKGCSCISENLANAKLIASAPQLLEALSDLVRFCEENNVGAELELAKNVIQKATE